MNGELIRARLQGPAADELAALALAHLLERPVSSLVEPRWLAHQAVLALSALTRSAETERWLAAQLRGLRDRVPPGRPGDHLPEELRGPLRAVVGRPVVLERELVARLLNHRAVERLLADVLSSALRGFARRIPSLLRNPAAAEAAQKGLGRLKMLSMGVKDLSDSMLGGLAAEVEQRAEQRMREFVDEALHVAMRQVVDHVADPQHAGSYAEFRVHLLDALLATRNEALVAELDKLDVENLVATAAGVARALARRPGLEDELARGLESAMREAGDRSLADFLRESGLEADRAELEAALVPELAARVRDIAATDAFAEWLERLLAPEP